MDAQLSLSLSQGVADVEDNSERFARVLPILLAVPSRWAAAVEPVLPVTLKQLCRDEELEEDDWHLDLFDPRKGVMWVGGGDCFDGESIYRALEVLQRDANAFRFLGTLACVSTTARAAVSAVATVSRSEMEVLVAQAAAMIPLCAQAMDVEVLREISIDQAIHLWRVLCRAGGEPPFLAEDEPAVTALGPKAVAERWREILRLGSTPEMQESKTQHLLEEYARKGESPLTWAGEGGAWPGGMDNLRRYRQTSVPGRPGMYIVLGRDSMENGKTRVHPLERLLFPWYEADDYQE